MTIYPTMKLIVERRRFPLAFANQTGARGTPPKPRILFAIYGMEACARPKLPPIALRNRSRTLLVLDWLVRDWTFFGMTGQVWMPVFGGALALYIAVLVITRHRRTGLHR
jgi:hypothetical protein